MNISWLKMDVNILDDSKIKLVRKMPGGSEIFVLWLGLLCLGMKSNNPGFVEISDGVPYEDEELATIFDLDLNIVRLGLVTFERLGMIQRIKGSPIEICNFRKHQSIDEIINKREMNRIRVTRYRANLQFKNEAMERDNNVCQYCGDEATGVDHVIPTSKGGTGSIENLVACCKRCNSLKSDQELRVFLDNNLSVIRHEIINKNDVLRKKLIEISDNSNSLVMRTCNEIHVTDQIRSDQNRQDQNREYKDLPPTAGEPKILSGRQVILDRYWKLYQQWSPSTKPSITGRCGKALNELRTRMEDADILTALERYFSSPDNFNVQQGMTLHRFCACAVGLLHGKSTTRNGGNLDDHMKMLAEKIKKERGAQ